jgi:signal peptidase II
MIQTQSASSKNEDPSAPLVQRILFILIACIVVLIDQLTKGWVENNMLLNTSWAPFPEISHLFQFTHVANTGAAFGSFAGGGNIFAIVAVIVTGAIIYYNFSLPVGMLSLRIALGLQLGGALGNLADRFRLGHVTDFLDFGPWYIFNIADTSIVVGVIILGILMWLEKPEETTQESTPSEITIQDETSLV